MKKPYLTLVILGVLFGATALLYLQEVHSGIAKNTPPCAPIRGSTVLVVFGLVGGGVAISILGLWTVRRQKEWLGAAFIAVLLNAVAFSVWTYWVVSETLLPYDSWCKKIGMP